MAVVAQDTRQRLRLTLWPFVASIICGLLVWEGLSYLLAPPKAPALATQGIELNDPWHYLRVIPGGMTTHGIALLVSAFIVAWVLFDHPDERSETLVLSVVCFYTLWSSVLLIAAWFAMPSPIWTSPSKWVAVTLLCIGLIITDRDAPSRKVDGA